MYQKGKLNGNGFHNMTKKAACNYLGLEYFEETVRVHSVWVD